MGSEDYKWYALRVSSGKENIVMKFLSLNIPKNNLENNVIDIMVPQTKVYVLSKTGKKKLRERCLMSGYVFIKAIFSDELMTFLKNDTSNCWGVLRQRGFGYSDPQPLTESQINKLLGKHDTEDAIVKDVCFVVGENVRIIEGAFNDFTGVVQNINQENRKLTVVLNIFGRETPVEVSCDQVKAL